MLLVVNAGSSSIKCAVFDHALVQQRQAQVAEIGPDGHRAALAGLLANGLGAGVTAAAHRIVHGGADLVQACLLTPAVIAAIEACIPLAPLHNPANLAGIRALAEIAPEWPQFASFDTAFHATNPPEAVTYALPLADRLQGLRRYGFHGISYAGLVRKVQETAGDTLPSRLLALHLGNGASLCAIRDGLSVATTMGYSPLDGITMGTRSGGIDGNAVLRLAELHGIENTARILNRESGLLGLGGHSDMRALQSAGTPEAAFAIRHFTYWVIRHAGSMIAAMGGLDAVAFTGGIGENDAGLRAAIMEGLKWAGPVPVFVVPAEEERSIAADALTLLREGA